MTSLTATYSPEDNKLRLYSATRLDSETYERVKAAGFKWAPRQSLFVAPMWTPTRADLLLELCEEIGDEDTSLVDRAEERAERFGEYSEKRNADAAHARNVVDSITQHIPFGQPILVGHHSERRARKDAERVDNAMRKAVSMWDTSNYWTARAKGALAHAKYKERPDVRARRIKKLEAEQRKQQRSHDELSKLLRAWSKEGLTREYALMISSRDHGSVAVTGQDFATTYVGHAIERDMVTVEQAAADRRNRISASLRWTDRWLEHTTNRLAYERAMLAETGGIPADKFKIQVGGRVRVCGEWLTVLRVNVSGETVLSVTTNAKFVPVKSAEEITDYQDPTPDAVAAAKAAAKLPPLVNMPGEGLHPLTKAEWKALHSDYKGTRRVKATETHGAYRQRYGLVQSRYVPVFITDEKRKPAPPPAPALPEPTPAPVSVEPPARALPAPRTSERRAAADPVANFRAQLASGGTKIAVAPQLFPTPATLAARMVEMASLAPGLRVLEPSAGTGVLVRAIHAADASQPVVIVEQHGGLAATLRASFADVHEADFLSLTRAELGTFDRILMNPPFANAVDIAHIGHAYSLLAPGGVLVAICAAGPRQVEKLKPLAEHSGGHWEYLPPDTFTASGASVRTVLLTLHAPMGTSH